MRSIVRLARLAPAERRAALEALVLVAAATLSLRVLPYGKVVALAGLAARRGAGARLPAERLAGLVAAAGRAVPASACLPRALALDVLLRRHSHDSSVCIGVAREPGGRVRAHAWVESDGRMVLGGFAPGRFAPLA